MSEASQVYIVTPLFFPRRRIVSRKHPYYSFDVTVLKLFWIVTVIRTKGKHTTVKLFGMKIWG